MNILPISNTQGDAIDAEVIRAAAPSTRPKVNTAPISAVASVSQGGAVPQSSPFPEYISFVLDNSAGGTTVNYIIGDANGLVALALGGSYTDPAPVFGTIAAFKSALLSSSIVIKGIQYEITTGSVAQFAQNLKYCKANVTGGVQAQPYNLGQNRRNSAQNDKILTIQQVFTMDSRSAIIVPVAASTAVTIGLYIGSEAGVF